MKKKSYTKVARYVIYTGEEFATPERAEHEALIRIEKLLRAYLSKSEYLRNNPIYARQFIALYELLIRDPEGMQEITDALTFGTEPEGDDDD